jgi:hypothetical protein
MKREEISVGMLLVGWTTNYGSFLIRVNEIKAPAGRKTRIRGTILKVVAPGIRDSFKYIGKEWEFGIINVNKPTEAELKSQIAPSHKTEFDLRLRELNRLVSITPKKEWLEEQRTIREMMGI